MAKKHMKRLRSEKSKVTLKGAKLQKGLNITKTDFKVKKIIVKEQLRDHVAPGTQKQFNIKETLAHLKHPRDKMRLDALLRIREYAEYIISTGGYAIEVIPNIAACSLDLEHKVRSDAIKTLGKLFALMPDGMASPNFNILSSYLRCAMMHIKKDIQEDALLFLDVLLKYIPEIFEINNEKMFQSFLEMISFARAGGDETKRALSVNIGQRHTATVWRTNVLLRVQKIMDILANKRVKEENSKKEKNRSLSRVVYYKPGVMNYFPVRRINTGEAIGFKDIFNSSMESYMNGEIAFEDLCNSDLKSVQTCTNHLMPLLFDTWLEVRPRMSHEKGQYEDHMTSEATDILKVILEIIAHLWSLVDQLDFEHENQTLQKYMQNEYAEKFCSHFYGQNFPFKQMEQLDAKKKPNPLTNNGGKDACILENVRFTYLMCRYCTNPSSKDAQIFGKFIAYLIDLVTDMSEHKICIEEQCALVGTLRAYLLNNSRPLLKLIPQKMCKLMRATIKACVKNMFNTQNGVSDMVVSLLYDIIADNELYSAYNSNEEFNELFAFLPQLLLKPAIAQSTAEVMLNICKRQNKTFLESLEKYVVSVIENLQALRVIGAVNALEGKKRIISMFYYTERCWSIEDLLLTLEKHVTDERIFEHFKSILKLKR